MEQPTDILIGPGLFHRDGESPLEGPRFAASEAEVYKAIDKTSMVIQDIVKSC